MVRGLSPLLVGKRLRAVIARRPDLRVPLPADLGQRLTGASVTGIRRRAKYGLLETDRGDTLIFHLGMSGKFRPMAAGEAPGAHDHVLLETEDARLAYHDPRRFGLMLLTDAPETHPLLAGLGPEPLGPDFNGAALARAADGRATPIKALLLDQHVVAGVGNIYASEALFAAGISPTRLAGQIANARLHRLAEALKAVLTEAIAAGGSTLRDHAQVSGDLGYFQHRFRVYGRAGQPCVTCGRPIRRIVQAGRSTFYCATCQR